MTFDQFSIIVILIIAMALFIWNHWRYDVVAGIVLVSAVLVGVVPAEHAFDGFSHPAVITVAAVLVISQALQSCGVVSFFLRYLAYARGTQTTQITANAGITAFLSAFMNNVGALALMLPVTLRDARKAKRSAGSLLMPLSFASLLGGLVTLIGTPPNIIISSFRNDNVGEPFSMFDFTPVGLVVALAGIFFIVTVGWRLIPRNTTDEASGGEQFKIARYVTEFRIPVESELVGATVGKVELMCDNDISIMALIRNSHRRLAPSAIEVLRAEDVLIIEGASEALQPLFEDHRLIESGAEVTDPDWYNSPDIRVIEAVVMPNSGIEGENMRALRMHQRFGVNLLAVAREGATNWTRLQFTRFRVGDVLLLQGEGEALSNLCSQLGCLAIKNRGLEIVPKRGAVATPLIFVAGILAAALDILPVQMAFVTVVGVLVLARLVSLREAYRSIEWPIIVLLGFLIPVGEVLQTTGATDLIAAGILSASSDAPLWAILALLMVSSMLLSDVVHNTPTALIMAPIAFSIANKMSLHPDAFLMAVAIGAASPYLTPIGHQSNTLVMGPGGYSFKDYWRMGLPLDAVIVCVGVPMILLVWVA